MAFEGGGLACKFSNVFLRENDLDVFVFFRFHANQGILKTGNKGIGSEFERIVIRFAAIEGLVIDESLEIQNDGVAFFGLAVHHFKLSGIFEAMIDSISDFFFGNRNHFTLGSEAFIGSKSHFRHQGHSENQGQFLIAHFGDIDFRTGEGLNLLFAKNLGVDGG